jgi:NhaP-type Na+/H+ or K+/H+ antiporter
MISFLGVVGTVICFFCLAICLNFLDHLFFDKLSMREILLLSSVLCATDTVAAMSLIKPERFPVLNAVLFGEGIINDAVAIILFRTVEKIKLGNSGVFT